MLLFIVMTVGAGCSGCASVSNQDYWMGVYYYKQKIGSFHVTVAKDRINDKGVFIRKEALRLRYRVPGNSYLYNIDRTMCIDSSLKPIYDKVTSDYKDDTMTGYYPVSAEIRYSPIGKTTKTIVDGETSEQTASWDANTRGRVTAGYAYDFTGTTLSIGTRLEVNRYRYSLSLSDHNIQTVYGDETICALRRETVKLDDVTFNAIVVSERGENTDITTWRSKDGEMIKQEIPADHIVWIRESKAKATEIDEGKGPLLDTAAEAAVDARTSASQQHRQAPAVLDYWMGIYDNSEKVGNIHVTVGPAKLDGKNVFRRDDVLQIRLKSATGPHESEISRTLYADSSIHPIEDLRYGKQIHPTSELSTIDIKYGKDSAAVTMTSDGKTATQTVPLSDIDKGLIEAGCLYDFGAAGIEAGQKLDINHPSIQIQPNKPAVNWYSRDGSAVVLRKERLTVNGKSYDVFVLSEMDKGGLETIKWQTAAGQIIKQEIPHSGVKWVLESKDEAERTESASQR